MREPNPYDTPGARVQDLPEPVNQHFRWKAVVIGAATDLGGSIVAGIVLVVFFALLAGPREGTIQDSVDGIAQSWPFLMASMVVGGAFTVLGGYVAGRVARHSFLKHALAAGVLSLAVGIVLFRGDEGPYSGLIAFLGYGLHLPLALLGGWLVWRNQGRRQEG